MVSHLLFALLMVVILCFSKANWASTFVSLPACLHDEAYTHHFIAPVDVLEHQRFCQQIILPSFSTKNTSHSDCVSCSRDFEQGQSSYMGFSLPIRLIYQSSCQVLTANVDKRLVSKVETMLENFYQTDREFEILMNAYLAAQKEDNQETYCKLQKLFVQSSNLKNWLRNRILDKSLPLLLRIQYAAKFEHLWDKEGLMRSQLQQELNEVLENGELPIEELEQIIRQSMFGLNLSTGFFLDLIERTPLDKVLPQRSLDAFAILSSVQGSESVMKDLQHIWRHTGQVKLMNSNTAGSFISSVNPDHPRYEEAIIRYLDQVELLDGWKIKDLFGHLVFDDVTPFYKVKIASLAMQRLLQDIENGKFVLERDKNRALFELMNQLVQDVSYDDVKDLLVQLKSKLSYNDKDYHFLAISHYTKFIALAKENKDISNQVVRNYIFDLFITLNVRKSHISLKHFLKLLPGVTFTRNMVEIMLANFGFPQLGDLNAEDKGGRSIPKKEKTIWTQVINNSELTQVEKNRYLELVESN